MLEVKRFSGVLNKDDSESDILPNQHIQARNIRFVGGLNGLTAYNIKGNFLVNNSSLPAGTNECIGAFTDSVKKRIIFFVYNSNGNHGIYQLSIQTGLITAIFIAGTNSATDILQFSLNYPVHSVALVYRTTGDGDLLYWTDGLNRPRYLNLDTVAALTPFTEDMINAAKNPPLRPITVNYFSDSAYNANQVKNKYFQFSYRWVYKNLEKSTFAPWSKVPIPDNIIFPSTDIAPNTNNAIGLINIISGADEDFQSIEIVGRVWLGAAWSDFFLIQTISRDDVGTPLPFSYGFSFYNNGTYSTIPPDDTDLYFDHLPDVANTLELLNGNVLIYGGIRSGYNNLTRQQVDVQITSALFNSPVYPAVTQAWKWAQYYRLGIQYFDKRAKPISGVVSFLKDTSIDTTNFDVTTPQSIDEVNGVSYYIPKISSVINHLPPADAESYAWVRQDLAPQFYLHWMTNDYQSDSQYLYLGIQSLIDANTNNGLLPSYEFTEGDRVRIISLYISPESTASFTTQLDFEILAIVQRTMGSGNPATNGAFIKVKKPAVFPSPPYGRNMLIEVYTPPAGLSSDTVPFYEWGERYGFQTILGVKYHLGGTQNQTASLPALTEWLNGDMYLKSRVVYTTMGVNSSLMVMDRRYNDFQESAANSNGRIWLIDENAKEEYNGVLVRWGGKYQAGTNINNLNRFRPNDFDEADRSKGDLRRFKARDKILRAFQDRGVGQWGIYARFIQNNSGVPELVTTNEIITTNNIQYYQGLYGLCGYPTNLCSSTIADYFVDVVTGREIRLSGDGITDLGLLYKGQFYFPSLVTPYGKQLIRTNAAISKVIKFFNTAENESHTVLQQGTGNGTTTTDQNYSFNESRNGFNCDGYDFIPELAISADNILYTFKNGQCYKHDNRVSYCNFYGVSYDASITAVFNSNILEKKSWQSLTEIASDTWAAPIIYTNTLSHTNQRQETNLVAAEFVKLENNPSCSIKRDVNSRGMKINGQFMKGNWCVIKFQKTNAANEISLSEVSLSFVDSARTTK